MIRRQSLLVRLVSLINEIPMPPDPKKRRRGHPRDYTDRLMLKALVIMIIRRLYSPNALIAFLQQDDFVTNQLRELLNENGKLPSRRTWERRLGHLQEDLPGLIG